MNFECWGIQISDMIHSVFVYTPDKGCHWQSRSDYQVGYRWTSFHEDNAIILAVCLKLNSTSSFDIKALMTKYLNERKQKQPIMNATFGSVFKNPLPKKAGQVVDEIGLKGTKVGDAMVSNKHANFFENIDSASYEDTINLIHIIQNKVNTMYNIKLECEVQILD